MKATRRIPTPSSPSEIHIAKMDQEPALEPTLHQVAKPVMRIVSFSMLGAGALGLTAAAIRTLRRG